MKLEGWINQIEQNVEGTYFKYNINSKVLWLMASEIEIFNYSQPTLDTRQQVLAGMRDAALVKESVGITVWEVVGTLISKD